MKKILTYLYMTPFIEYAKKASSWFLLGLVFLTCLNSYLAWNVINSQKLEISNQSQKIQILHKNIQGGFNNSYLAISDLGLVNINSTQSLNIGSKYIVKSILTEYTVNDPAKPFDRYYRSLGVVAKLDIKSAVIISGCDFFCVILSQVNNFQNWTLRSYGQTFCQDNYTIVRLTGVSGCQDGYALSLGLMLGEDGYFTKELKSSFKKLGLTHLTAFSGMQTVLILALLEKSLVNIKFNSNLRYLLAILAMLLIILVAGFSPPVLRSVVSVLISMSVVKFFGRKISSYRCLIMSGGLMCLLNPLYLINISFQLSFVATLGVIMSGIFENKNQQLNSLTNNIWSGFLQSGLCIIMTMPIILQLGSGNWLISLIANIIFVPVLNFLTLFNYLLLLPVVSYILSPILVLFQSFVTQVIIEIAKFAPNPNLRFELQLFDYILYYGLIFGICYGYWYLSRSFAKDREASY